MEREWSSPTLGRIAGYCAERTGLASLHRRVEETEAAIRRAISRQGAGSAEQYLVRLREEPTLLDDLVDEVVVGETYFFREPGALEYLKGVMLPGLERLRQPGHVFRIWSAGCASGEEAYTLSILAHESEWRGRVHILGTDISRGALARAELGEYSSWSLRTTPPEAVSRWFRKNGTRLILAERYRKPVEFRYLNLATDRYPDLSTGTAGVDVILCRNVLMYFPGEVVEQVAQGFFRSLAPGGWLLTGASDPPLAAFAGFDVLMTEAGVFYRRASQSDGDEATGRTVILEGIALNGEVAWSEDRLPAGSGSGREAQVGAVDGAADGVLHRMPDEAGGETRTPGSAPVAHSEAGPPEGPKPATAGRGVLRAVDGSITEEKGGRSAGTAATGVPPEDELEAARQLCRSGDARAALELLERIPSSAAGSALQAHALASLGRYEEAEELARKAVSRFPGVAESHFVLAMLLFERGRAQEASAELRRVLYLDGTAALPHFVQGLLLQKAGKMTGARRSFRNAYRLASAGPGDAILPYSDEQLASNLASAAEAQMAVVDRILEGRE